ncbi:MAG: phosphate acyltransferase PlsX [SAR324 cluster bacterium]|nr:phosphate acyltransferase PlsX [SAR324 cluster bacterium]
MWIAVDAMGGDTPLTIPVEGAVRAINDFDLNVALVGQETAIRQELQKYSYDPSKIKIIHCDEYVRMEESPAVALRQKKNSSIRVAIDKHKAGEVDAVVSAGHTGASMATAKMVLKSLKGIDRPAIIAVMPSSKGNFVLLDVGANTDCKPHYLLEFALMGEAYSQGILHNPNPRVGLLNNGEEEGKGNYLAKETYNLLKESTLNFVGNIEGKAMFKGEADVVVCDGFVGNVTLKVAEGTFDLIKTFLQEEISKSFLAKISYLGMKPIFKALKERADYKEIGGAPLLGVNGTVIICHGSSSATAIRNAVKHAHDCATVGLNDMIAKLLNANQQLIEKAINLPQS